MIWHQLQHCKIFCWNLLKSPATFASTLIPPNVSAIEWPLISAWKPPVFQKPKKSENMSGLFHWCQTLFKSNQTKNSLPEYESPYPTKREKEKIIDSKVPKGRRYVGFQEGFFLHNDNSRKKPSRDTVRKRFKAPIAINRSPSFSSNLAQPWLIIMTHHSLSKARQFTSKWQCCVEPSSEYRRRNGWCPTTPDLCMHLRKHHWFFRS